MPQSRLPLAWHCRCPMANGLLRTLSFLTLQARPNLMNKKPSGTPGPSIFLFRLFASHAAMMFLAFPLHAGAQQPQETSFNQQAAAASAGANPSVSLVDAPSATFSRAAATADAPATGAVRPPPAKLTREEKIQSESQPSTACEEGRLRGKPCQVSWSRLLGGAFTFLAPHHARNLPLT